MSKALGKFIVITAWIIFGYALATYNQVSLAAFLPFGIGQGGTATSTPPKYGDVFVGQSNGTWKGQATFTLGIESALPTDLTVTGTATSTFAGFIDVNGTG